MVMLDHRHCVLFEQAISEETFVCEPAHTLVRMQEQADQLARPCRHGSTQAGDKCHWACSSDNSSSSVPGDGQDEEAARRRHRLSSARAAARKPGQHRCTVASLRSARAQDRAWGFLHTKGPGSGAHACVHSMAHIPTVGTSVSPSLPVRRLRCVAARVCGVRARRLCDGALRGATRGTLGGDQPAAGRRWCESTHLNPDLYTICEGYSRPC